MVSYSLRPDFTGSIVNADTILLPAFTAELVIFARAVTPITSRAEKRMRTFSTALPRPFISTFLAALLRLSKPLEESPNFRLRLSLSSVDIVVETLRSNWLLSNRISTTLLSTVLLIC